MSEDFLLGRWRRKRWRSLSSASALLAVVAHLVGALPAAGEFYPLPPWFIYGGGIGSTWGGSSTSPDNAQLNVAMSPPTVPNQYVTAVAMGSTYVLQIAPATTYSLTLSASVSGSAACESLMVDGNNVISYTLISSLTWKRYTNSFTTGGPDDPLVGRYLNVQLLLMKSGFNYGSATASFTNLQFQAVTARPKLTLQQTGPGVAQLQWPTNFYWYVPEHTTNVDGVWEDLTNQATIQGNQFALPVDSMSEQRYFRLRQP